jgi:NTP pyrophosphatase (non-canonical NTP hydrolase)
VRETAEALLKEARNEQLDAVNVGEEIGDVCWYLALAIDELHQLSGVDAGDILHRNRQKLLARQKAGTVTSKEGRDLGTERAILEGEFTRVAA